jgi:hypothetical protein
LGESGVAPAVIIIIIITMALRAHIHPGLNNMPVGGRGSETKPHPIDMINHQSKLTVGSKEPNSYKKIQTAKGSARLIEFNELLL